MKRGIILIFLAICLISTISAEIIFTNPLKDSYNLGEKISIPITIKTNTDVTGVLQMNLICNNSELNFYKNGIKLLSGEEKTFDSYLILIREIISYNKGDCRIKAILNQDYVLSEEFRISDWLILDAGIDKTDFDAGEDLNVRGNVYKENGAESEGLIEVKVISLDNTEILTQMGSVTKGAFNLNLSLPLDLASAEYFLQVDAYEETTDSTKTNEGIKNYTFFVRQVPTNLELIFESDEILPGESFSMKTILHDQTGESINSTALITITDSDGILLEQKEINCDETLQYSIKSTEPPSEWTVLAKSNGIESTDSFEILKNEKVEIEIVNKTLLVTNIGNVPYNKTLLVKIGDESLNIDVELKLGESQKYVLTAPEGDYEVTISAEDQDEVTEMMSLTGKTVDIKESSRLNLFTLFWIILILILAATVYFIYRKIHKKPFFGKINLNKIFSRKINKFSIKDLNPSKLGGNKAEFSLSIKGDKQDANVICLKIDRFEDVKNIESVTETLKKIKDFSERNKAVSYESKDYIFFIFAPAKTRTFKNEKVSLETANEIEKILKEHNKKFKQKIKFGISLNYGSIIGKLDHGVFKFMAMGTLMTSSKKIASLANNEILLDKKIGDLLRVNTKLETENRDGTSVFKIKEIKKENKEAREFINKFVNRQKKKSQ